ncbi:hypothetical protein QFC22_005011 [Naganishia vaughanmartiniae]|uniref:Uncharacterized protein n=1 Tax=Naganishia vaughanmartiniae TaxID=1424756 RepID=A0ACC2WVS5_9TREE|nr:hypothetical protein QFC22_005011 [Naganishia vaughanmartiniae]
MGYVTRYPTEPDDPSWPEYNLEDCADTEEDQPVQGIKLKPEGSDGLPPLVLGTGTFNNIYDTSANVTGDHFLRITRLALRYGINAFDTAPHYHPSEIVLGKALKALRPEYPRESYQIITKTGKYSPMRVDHDLSEKMIRLCVERSLKRFETDYLDVVYLHDVEFNSSLNPPAGNHTLALSDPATAEAYGLAPGNESKIWGDGDQRILDAMSVLRELKKEGKIKHIGFSAYPLPTLLRLSLLVLHTAPFEPVDIIQTYSHQNLQNMGLAAYLPEFRTRAKVGTVMNASPLNMGLLTTSGPPDWHPAPKELRECVNEAKEIVKAFGVQLGEGGQRSVKIEDLAVSFGMRDLGIDVQGSAPPVVVGCGTLSQVHQAVASFIAVKDPKDKAKDEQLRALEQQVRDHIESRGFKDWSWESPQPGT